MVFYNNIMTFYFLSMTSIAIAMVRRYNVVYRYLCSWLTGCKGYWPPIFKIASWINHQSDHDKIFTIYPPLHLLLRTGVHLPARLKGPQQESQRGGIVKKIRGRGKTENKKKIKYKGYDNCRTEHKLILTHFEEI